MSFECFETEYKFFVERECWKEERRRVLRDTYGLVLGRDSRTGLNGRCDLEGIMNDNRA